MSLLKHSGRIIAGMFQGLHRNIIFAPPCALGFVSSAVVNRDEDLLKGNPFYDKYSKKISDLKKTEPEDLLAKLNEIRKRPQGNPHDRNNKRGKSSFTKQQDSLTDLIDVEFFRGKTSEDVAEMWMKLHFQHEGCIAGVLSSDAFSLILERSSKYPTFLLPLPRYQGYEYIVSQFNGSEVHFTPLINYQAFKENSPECLYIRHYTELAGDKSVVLMRGEYDADVINSTEAVCLSNQLQRYYGGKDTRRVRLLQHFNESPEDFQHMDLIVELERLAHDY